MNIEKHKEIILKWIKSCRTAEQIDLLNEIIGKFVIDRFSGIVQSHELDMVLTELNEAINIRRIIVARKRLKKKDILAKIVLKESDQRIDENLKECID